MLSVKTLTIDDFVLFSEKMQGHGLFEFIGGQIMPVQGTEPLDESFIEQILQNGFESSISNPSFPVATQKHDKIVSNLHGYLFMLSKKAGLSVYSQGTDVLANGEMYKPDIVLVEKNAEIREKHHILNPVLMVEVLSRSTQAKDKSEKLDNYQSIPELKAYWLISQNEKKSGSTNA
jgi:hypothetical protein